MCGIAGVIDLERKLDGNGLQRLVRAMCDLEAHRGPDDAGTWVDAEAGVALGHRRLSIIDLRPEGRQPMSGVGVSTMVTYNGEIYNFEEVRGRLKRKGRQFKSRSDTELLPHLFENLDPAGLGQLNGMFAFAVWHPEMRRLMLARDSFGKKPLYIYQDDRFFAFASEIQCFYALPGFKADLDRDALAEFLMLSYIPGPSTIYRHVRQLPAGSFETLSFDPVKTEDKGAFFRFNAIESPALAEIDRRVLKARLRTKLVEAVERRMISDVPLGAFLSGGVDSALVAAVARKELVRELDTFSIGFENSAESEHEAAREISAHLGTRHHDRMLAPNGLEMIGQIAKVLDQPNGDSSCLPTYLLSQFAREHVTVCLSGDGGDELFGGYGRYRDTMMDWGDPQRIRNNIGIDPAKARPSDVYMSLRWHIWLPSQVEALMGGMPSFAEGRVASWRASLNDETLPLMHRMRNIDTHLYMPGAVLAKVDRMSMQHALEVRCPLLDRDFAELAMGVHETDCWIAPDVTKSILKEIALDYLPREWMYRPKKGFGLPSAAWAMGNVVDLCQQVLKGSGATVNQHLDRRQLEATVEHQSQPGQFSIYQMWPLLILELWLRDQPAKIATAAETSLKEAA